MSSSDQAPATPVDDLRERVQRVLRERCEVDDRQYTDGTGWVLVRDDNAAQVVADYVAPVLEGLRAEVERLTNVGRVEASAKADAMITADVWKHRHDNVLRELEQKRGESGQAELLHEVEQWRATFGETALRDATAIIAERDVLRAQLDRAVVLPEDWENRISDALEDCDVLAVADWMTARKIVTDLLASWRPSA